MKFGSINDANQNSHPNRLVSTERTGYCVPHEKMAKYERLVTLDLQNTRNKYSVIAIPFETVYFLIKYRI